MLWKPHYSLEDAAKFIGNECKPSDLIEYGSMGLAQLVIFNNPTNRHIWLPVLDKDFSQLPSNMLKKLNQANLHTSTNSNKACFVGIDLTGDYMVISQESLQYHLHQSLSPYIHLYKPTLIGQDNTLISITLCESMKQRILDLIVLEGESLTDGELKELWSNITFYCTTADELVSWDFCLLDMKELSSSFAIHEDFIVIRHEELAELKIKLENNLSSTSFKIEAQLSQESIKCLKSLQDENIKLRKIIAAMAIAYTKIDSDYTYRGKPKKAKIAQHVENNLTMMDIDVSGIKYETLRTEISECIHYLEK